MQSCVVVAAALVLGVGATDAAADQARIAVAANFGAPMKAIVAAFERDTGHEVKVSFGSTGKLYAQIRNGAPFEALLAADQRRPILLEQQGLAVPGSRFTYAVGTLVLWSSQPGLVVNGAELLKDGDFERLSIANPKLAPYGQAATEVLEALGVLAAVAPKLVMGENISQTYQFVDTGNAQLGFVALSQVVEGGAITKGSGWVVPAQLHQPIRQDAVILARGGGHAAVSELFAFLKGEKARAIIDDFGYETE
jgi:molybdate transport system substrate-binding protein